MKSLNKDINETGVLLKELAATARNPSERERLEQEAQTYSVVLDRIEGLDKKLIADSNQRLKIIHETESKENYEGESLIQSQ